VGTCTATAAGRARGGGRVGRRRGGSGQLGVVVRRRRRAARVAQVRGVGRRHRQRALPRALQRRHALAARRRRPRRVAQQRRRVQAHLHAPVSPPGGGGVGDGGTPAHAQLLIRLILRKLTWLSYVQPRPFLTQQGQRYVSTHGGVHFFDGSQYTRTRTSLRLRPSTWRWEEGCAGDPRRNETARA
jgi:hypothetical protein